MDPRTEPVCVCGHMEGYHSGPSFAATYPHKAYWCCRGSLTRRTCHCPYFRLAIAQPSDRERIENPRRP